MERGDDPRYVRIGRLAAELGLNPKTIRYYEEIGLLPSPTRTPAGYRLYRPADRDRLRFILKAKAIGLSLEEIREILALRRDGRQPCARALTLLDQKLALVDRRLQALAEVREEIAAIRREAVETMGADASICGIIEYHQLASSLNHRDAGERGALTHEAGPTSWK
jgi:DNA-binding transcriptional MerR regulator